MHKFKSELEIRNYVKLLKNFYGEVASYLLLNAAFIILWILAGGGYFWPIWPIIVWMVALVIKASKLKLVDEAIYQHCDAFRNKLPFIKSEWTEDKVKELLVYLNRVPSISTGRASVSKPLARKVSVKKSSSLKRPSPRKK